MYKIDRRSNSIEKVDKKTFSELGFKERQNLQEWIAKEPTCLGEELLIIQKEFDGFDDTRERLDLLALDKSGSSLFANISPSKEHWISAGSGMRACPFTFVFSKKYGRVELYIDRGEQDENEFIFNELLKYKSDIEAKFGNVLIWEQLPTKRACRIKYEKPYDGYNREIWDDMVTFMVDAMCKFEKAMKPYIEEVNKNKQQTKVIFKF